MSGKRKPDVRGLLLEGHFGASRDLPAVDPLTTTPMILEIDRIQPYDRNPRRELNPRFQDIKASIRAQGGLNNPLTVTRRPGEEHYLVEAGGNTRLTILQELWQETGDPRFQRIHCLFVPWRSESHVLGAHLIENELRGDMPLIDRALAVRALQELLEAESGTRLSRSELQRTLTSLGYQISRRQLSRYHYAADVLAPLIPKALAAGYGRYHVDALRSIEGAYRRLFASLAPSAAAFEPWFAATLSGVDRTDLTLEVVRDTLAQSLAKRSGRSCSQIHAQIEALLKDLPSGPGEVDHSDEALMQIDSEASVLLATNPAVEPVVSTVGISNDQAKAHVREVVAHSSGEPSHTPEMTRSVRSRRDSAAKPLPHQGSESRGEATSELSAGGGRQSPDPSDRETLRGQAYESAGRIAQALEFPDAVQPWQGGYGFILDLPEQPLTDEQAWAGWWLLLGISEQAVSADRLALMPKANGLGAALSPEGQAMLPSRAGSPPSLTLLPFYLLQSRQLPEGVFSDFLNLIACCRTLRHQHLESELWDCITVEQSQLRAQLAGLGDPGDG